MCIRDRWRPDVTAWARCGSTHSWIYIVEIHPVPSRRWGCENTIKYSFLLLFPHPGAISPMGAISRLITVVIEPFIQQRHTWYLVFSDRTIHVSIQQPTQCKELYSPAAAWLQLSVVSSAGDRIESFGISQYLAFDISHQTCFAVRPPASPCFFL